MNSYVARRIWQYRDYMIASGTCYSGVTLIIYKKQEFQVAIVVTLY